MQRNFVIGLDFGTDSIRGVLLDTSRQGGPEAFSEFFYPRWKEKKFCDPARNQFRQHPKDYIEGLDPVFQDVEKFLYGKTYTADEAAGYLDGKWAGKLNLPAGVLVGIGELDAHFAAIGGGIQPYQLCKVMGTSICDIVVSARENLQNVKGICGQVKGSVIPGMTGMEAGQSAFGDIFNWFAELVLFGASVTSIAVSDKALKSGVLDALNEAASKIVLREDLELAAEWLPAPPEKEGRVGKVVADHLLSEVYISLGEYENAIESASRVINSGDYQLMTSRFGGSTDQPGDVYSDLFQDGNFNRSSGNLESIYVWQFEEYTPGGGGIRGGNGAIRNFGPFLTHINAPDGVPMIPTDTLGRGVGRVRGTVYSLYDIWKDESDIRNSAYNFRREFYYNNPDSEYFGQPVEPRASAEDTLRSMYPYPRKIEGTPWEGNNTSGRIADDVYVYRLAETYLLRAEAYLRKGDIESAASDINVVRSRANAVPVTPGEVTIDYILDERARELLFEEPRRRTLIRMGKLVERVREYGLLESSRSTIQDYHELWPIPQVAIEANLGAELEQNPGY